jgi:hypothetical protein
MKSMKKLHMPTTSFYSAVREREERNVVLFGDHAANLEDAHKVQ